MKIKTSQKLRGGYYTPKPIADFISKWAIRSKDDTVLEPSCGDGIFLESIIEQYIQKGADSTSISSKITAIEFDKKEAEKSKERFSKLGIETPENQIIQGDFFLYCINHLSEKQFFDCIVGNPPFIRYQDFPEKQMLHAFALMKRADLHPNRLINTWIPFLVSSSMLLKNNGRIGMVIPAELFQVDYAAETRLFLSKIFSKIIIITFRQLVFKNIQQEVILFLGEKNGTEHHGISVVEVKDTSELASFNINNIKKSVIRLNHSDEKWTQYFLTGEEINLLRKLKNDPSISLSGEYIDVDVGIVTGENKFFVLSKEILESNRLTKFATKIIGKSNHLKGISLKNSDWDELVKSNYQVFLLSLPALDSKKLPSTLKAYIEIGEKQEINKGFKCSKRKFWYVVPSVWVPDAFMLRQVHEYPKIIINRCHATTTDTIHRVKFINGHRGEVITSAFINSLTFAFAEVTGRSYGGGVLTFEPSEAERLPLPIKFAEQLKFQEIDKLIRAKNIEKVLDINDDILLKQGLNLTDNEISRLRGIWIKLRNRRIERKDSKS